jgi:hypothetical protein
MVAGIGPSIGFLFGLLGAAERALSDEASIEVSVGEGFIFICLTATKTKNDVNVHSLDCQSG